MRTERQTCQRRRETPLPYVVNEDWWERARWGTRMGRAVAWWYHSGAPGEMLRRLHRKAARSRLLWRLCEFIPNPCYNGVTWSWPWQPRTCSFCGGVHPEDAIVLIKEGWPVEVTTRMYKFYLKPPRGHASPVPPVTVYLQHFTKGQADDMVMAAKGRAR